MRIVFAGTPANAATTLQRIIDEGLEVVGVITRTDALVGRKRLLTPSPVTAVALANNLPLLRTNSIAAEEIDWIRELNADLGVIVAYGSILKEDALSVPSRGWINLHYSLLPKYPGAAPVQHSLLAGEKTTGVSVFRLDEGVDSGPILAQEEVAINDSDNSSTLLERLTDVGSALLVDTLRNFDERIANQRVQVLAENRDFSSKITREQAKISFNERAERVNNLVRAMNPEPMSWFETNGGAVRLISSKPSLEQLPVGEASLVNGRLLVGCSDRAIELLEVQPSGKSPMPAADWFRGLRAPKVNLW